MNEKLIKQLREGTIALKNDGTLEELEKVLQYAFPNDLYSSGKYPYYQAYVFHNRQWYPELETKYYFGCFLELRSRLRLATRRRNKTT